jgi:hypothetical protein
MVALRATFPPGVDPVPTALRLPVDMFTQSYEGSLMLGGQR